MNIASDADLMRDVGAGRTSALAALFERHHARLYRYCVNMTGDRHAAEDLVQDTFIRILKYGRSYRGDSDFAPWMFRIAHNACIDHLRRRKLHDGADRHAEDTALDAPGADVCAASDETAHLLRRALMSLPVQGREVLVLSRYDFKTYEEIAVVLGCSVGAVKVRAHRAMKQLREAYLELIKEVAT